MTFPLSVLLLLVLLISLAVTKFCIRWAHQRDLIDHPNHRSSHTTPTPRGGGVALVVSLYIGLTAAAALDWISWRPLALVLCGLPIAVIGYADDALTLSARTRLLVQAICAGLALWVLNPLPALTLFGAELPGSVTVVLYFLGIIWLTNLYNFMDGIDGIAALETIAIALCWIALLGLNQATIPLILICATVGFLYFNWPPARIFMGDVGSAFCGFVIAGLALFYASADQTPVLLWLIPASAFIVDATVTLIVRILRGRRPGVAHRSHAYQHAARKIGKHLPVSLAYFLLSTLWLGVIAFWVRNGSASVSAEVGFLIAIAPLVVVALALRAGRD
jgi:Fuc2NAc and GlcNAc transferase